MTIVRLGVDVWLGGDEVLTEGLVGVDRVSAGTAADGPWTDVSLASVGTWGAKMGRGGQVPADIAPA